MIILDEFTHVIEDKTENQKKAVRHLKSMLSEGTCQFVIRWDGGIDKHP